ncbi:flavin reductase [Xanthomonas sp. Leaf131]|nr:flavin reductase [Xanthomonas sp. Leaf131]
MNITLFGATGKTGRHLIDQGLQRGDTLTVVARTGSRFAHPTLRVLRGDLTDTALLRDAVRGSDAVVSALGPTTVPHPGNQPITRATEAIIAAMAAENVSRLIAVSTGTAADPADRFDWKVWLPALPIRLAMRDAYRDIVGLAAAVRACPLDWTLVRVAFLTNRPASPRLNVGLYGHTTHSMTVSRADVAAFMFDQIGKHELLRQAPGISAHG